MSLTQIESRLPVCHRGDGTGHEVGNIQVVENFNDESEQLIQLHVTVSVQLHDRLVAGPITRYPGDRSDDLCPILPWILAVVGAQNATIDDFESLSKFVLQFALPLECEVRRSNDQDTLNQTARLEFLQEETGHDGLSSAGIVGKKKSDPGKFQEAGVDGFELVRKRIDASYESEK